jgi:hypothetical protein
VVTNLSAPSCFCLCSFCFWGEVYNSWILNDIGRNSLLGNKKKIAKFLMRTFTCRSTFLYAKNEERGRYRAYSTDIKATRSSLILSVPWHCVFTQSVITAQIGPRIVLPCDPGMGQEFSFLLGNKLYISAPATIISPCCMQPYHSARYRYILRKYPYITWVTYSMHYVQSNVSQKLLTNYINRRPSTWIIDSGRLPAETFCGNFPGLRFIPVGKIW